MIRPNGPLTRYAPLPSELLPDLSGGECGLHPAESRELLRISDPLRRRQWLWGRRLSKELIRQSEAPGPLSAIAILSLDERGRGVRPRAYVNAQPLDGVLSIAHSDRGVLAAWMPGGQFTVGVDLVAKMPTSRSFYQLWFTPREQRAADLEPATRAQIWAIKEAVYKALNRGESWDPREVEALPTQPRRFACTYRGQRLEQLAVDLQAVGGELSVIVGMPKTSFEEICPPRAARQPAHQIA